MSNNRKKRRHIKVDNPFPRFRFVGWKYLLFTGVLLLAALGGIMLLVNLALAAEDPNGVWTIPSDTAIASSGDNVAAQAEDEPIPSITFSAPTEKTSPDNTAEKYPNSVYGVFPNTASFDEKLVAEVQKRLNDLGHDCPLTNRYDATTAMAIADFQADHGLTIDGILGPITWNALGGNSRWSFSSMWFTADLKHCAAVLGEETLVYVNCGSDPHLTVYAKADEVWYVAWQAPCAIGSATKYGNLTPLGLHYVWDMTESFTHGDYQYWWAAFYTVGEDEAEEESEFGIHSVGYDPNTKEWQNWVLDRTNCPDGRLTNGCIRVDSATALWLYQRAYVGLPIIIDSRDYAEVIRSY